MKPLTLLTKSEITKLKASLDARSREWTDKLIAAGHGYVTDNELHIMAKTNPFIAEWAKFQTEALRPVIAEIRRRETYHGTLDRIIERSI